MLLLLILPISRLLLKPAPEVPLEKVELLEKQIQEQRDRKDKPDSTSAKSKKNTLQLQTFNPNKVSEEELLSFGIRDKLATTWMNFLKKGGGFSTSEDLTKLYGIQQHELEAISPYLQFDNKEAVASTIEPVKFRLDINSADTTALMAVPGIGSYYAQGIVGLRDKYCGILDKNHLLDLYKVDSTKLEAWFEYLYIDSANIEGIKINQSSKEELAKHPYINYNLANSIVKYREKHGAFKRVEDLTKLVLMHDTLFVKLAPYIKTDD